MLKVSFFMCKDISTCTCIADPLTISGIDKSSFLKVFRI